MKVTIIEICPDGDGYTMLWVDNVCRMEGDYYHDKIDDRIEGFLEGLKIAGKNVEVRTLSFFYDDDDGDDWYNTDFGGGPNDLEGYIEHLTDLGFYLK